KYRPLNYTIPDHLALFTPRVRWLGSALRVKKGGAILLILAPIAVELCLTVDSLVGSLLTLR
ncbi:MAG TPA: hypothetical protein VEF34_04020, partial [Syntrophobacteraceae bacterium]|nr:hypothetical protein [Syntrophobacteraceae bacterium]